MIELLSSRARELLAFIQDSAIFGYIALQALINLAGRLQNGENHGKV